MIKKILFFLVITIALLLIIAAVSLKLHDKKEDRWFTNANIRTSEHLPDTITTVCILATVHQPTDHYNAGSIFNILTAFQPDLILTEEDTALFENYHQRYEQTLKPSWFARLGRSFGFGHPDEIEGRAVRKYKIIYPAVAIRPFDYEGRNDFYQKHNSFANEAAIGNAFERLSKNGSLGTSQASVYLPYLEMNRQLDSIIQLSPYQINQENFYELSALRQHYQYGRLLNVVNTNDSLKKYREFYKVNADFWDTRNKKMAEHILNFVALNPGKRIMVLTGAMHKYYLLKELFPLQSGLKFRLREYYSY